MRASVFGIFWSVILIPSTVLAQSCEAVYRDAVRNISIEVTDDAVLNAIYRNQCTDLVDRGSASSSFGAGIVVDGLPIGLDLSGSSSRDLMESFCSTYSSRYQASRERVTYESRVVEGALLAFNACMEIEAQTGIRITHRIANPTAIAVDFHFRNTGSVITVNGVVVDNLECRANGLVDDVLGFETTFEARSNFTILCRRLGREADDGTIYFPSASLSIGNTVASYSISVFEDQIYNNELASETTRHVQELQDELDAMRSRNGVLLAERDQALADLSALSSRVNNMEIGLHSAVVSDFNPGGVERHFATGTSLVDVHQAFCPGAFKSGAARISSTEGCGGHGCDWVAAFCAYY
ncbi:MAG: hypothetical protein H6842_15265 [Rhodospirillaceae bacterium]|nr:hypothetical protein [Rhodospirillaceae bacterium]